MTLNQTQKYTQEKLNFAQEDLKTYGIDLGLKGPVFNTIRTVDRGVKSIKSGAVNARRSKQRTEGIHVRAQEYLYPIKDKHTGERVVDAEGKPAKMLLQYGVIKKMDPDYADDLRLKLSNQAEGLIEVVKQMGEA